MILNFTQHDGRSVYINLNQIHYFEPYDGQTHVEYPTAETRIETSHFCFYVREDYAAVVNKCYESIIETKNHDNNLEQLSREKIVELLKAANEEKLWRPW